jgi:hypothetical protein
MPSSKRAAPRRDVQKDVVSLGVFGEAKGLGNFRLLSDDGLTVNVTIEISNCIKRITRNSTLIGGGHCPLFYPCI